MFQTPSVLTSQTMGHTWHKDGTHTYSYGWTTAVRLSPVFRSSCSTDCSPSWCSGSTRLLNSEVRSRHSAAARPSLVERPGANRVSSGLWRSWLFAASTVLLHRIELQRRHRRVTDLYWRRWLRSASTTALVVPIMRHTTIGDCAFPAAAAVCGTVYRRLLCCCHYYRSSRRDWKPNSFCALTPTSDFTPIDCCCHFLRIHLFCVVT